MPGLREKQPCVLRIPGVPELGEEGAGGDANAVQSPRPLRIPPVKNPGGRLLVKHG